VDQLVRALYRGAALIALAVCYWMIEIKGMAVVDAAVPILGVNALAVFFLSTLLAILLTRVRVPVATGQSRSSGGALRRALRSVVAAHHSVAGLGPCQRAAVARGHVAALPKGRAAQRLIDRS
jgi:predicted acyltransferase